MEPGHVPPPSHPGTISALSLCPSVNGAAVSDTRVHPKVERRAGLRRAVGWNDEPLPSPVVTLRALRWFLILIAQLRQIAAKPNLFVIFVPSYGIPPQRTWRGRPEVIKTQVPVFMGSLEIGRNGSATLAQP
jgi:hypothetical protein